ncbi:MAG: tetraacyldisaccharide 4'-kinase [Betaproteobacteria bacterium]|nr:tetraacyldisaccharide 4'-kinase [Betaproteobacteria bacterium]MSQ88792.1 tetraacyldisaccharide 4'-kinase [Betaproteobacteria bacterium]
MKHWSRRGAVASLLWPASLAFGVLVCLRRWLYRINILESKHPGVPVIVVGNLTVGGSGKTPLVLRIVELLRQHQWQPGIVSRGYGGSAAAKGGAPREANSVADPAEVGDEPILLARRGGCPVWVGPERAVACRRLLEQYPECDVIVTDDGLQHYALARDLEICVVDGRGFGNGFLLPAGPLRESPARLSSVDAVVTHECAAVKGYAMQLQGETLVRLTDAHDVRPVQSFRGQKVHAVAGIGDPQRFFRHLARLGLQPVPHAFADHHWFRAEDLDFGDQMPVVMTEKDAVKCRRLAKENHWVFPVSASLDPAFERWLLEKLSGYKAA